MEQSDIDFCLSNFDRTLSVMGNARRLHDLNPNRSVRGWENYLRSNVLDMLDDYERLKPGQNQRAGQSMETEILPDVEGKGYYYDAGADEYITFLSCAEEMIRVSGDKHRAMKEAYSNMVGKPASMNEMSRRFGIPRAWFDEYRRRHGWTHDMDPYTDEEVAVSEPEQLVDDLILRRRQALHQRYEKRKWEEIEKDAESYRMFANTVLNEFRGLMMEPAPEVQRLPLGHPIHDYALVISPTDFHWGKHGWVDEVGEHYGFDEARRRLMEKTEDLVNRLPGSPEKIIVATGSDWFHVDTDGGTTTKGTPQDMCGSPAEILMSGCRLAREHIDLLRQVSDVEVVFMPGNHDRMSSIALMMYLSAVYEDCDDCEVVVSPATRQYLQYGNTLMGFIHGDGARNLVELMSVEQRQLWGKCEHHVWFHGHLHHQKVTEKGGAIIYQLPSLAGHDRYHYRNGYTTSRAGLSAHIVDKQHGVIGSLFAPVH